MFTRFDNIKGFTMYEVLLCFSIIQFGFAFNEVFARGVDKFDDLIIQGNFDRLLLRPKNRQSKTVLEFQKMMLEYLIMVMIM